jgi:hypothetical protein
VRAEPDGKTAALTRLAARAAQDDGPHTRQRVALTDGAGYYERNAPHMRDDAYLASGWPIGTGGVEGACRHLVKDRLEQAGMRWTRSGAQALLDLRAVRLNGLWDASWRFHRQQHHRRRSPAPPTADTPIDLQILDAA